MTMFKYLLIHEFMYVFFHPFLQSVSCLTCWKTRCIRDYLQYTYTYQPTHARSDEHAYIIHQTMNISCLHTCTHIRSVGVLDAVTHGYSTVLRSHTQAILAIVHDPSPDRHEVIALYIRRLVSWWISTPSLYTASHFVDCIPPRCTIIGKCLLYLYTLSVGYPSDACMVHAWELICGFRKLNTLLLYVTPHGYWQVATVGADGSIRVWDCVSGQQKYEFLCPDDAPLCIAYRPGTYILWSRWNIIVTYMAMHASVVIWHEYMCIHI